MAKSKILNKGAEKASDFAFQKDGSLKPGPAKTLSRLLSVQRPVVLAYVRSVRRRHPDATPEQLVEILSKHYLNLATGTGAAVGATAVVPGLGTVAAVGVAAAETAGFLEASALYAQSLAEVHGLQVRDPARANALVMGLMLGNSGRDLVKKFAGQASGGEALTAGWAQTVTSQLPASLVDSLVKRMRRTLLKKYATRSAGSLFGRILPFGIGALIGGIVNRKMAKTVIENSKDAYGAAPATFDDDLNPRLNSARTDTDLLAGFKKLVNLRKKKAAEDAEAAYGTGRRKSKGDVINGEVADSDDAPKTYRPDVKL